MGLVAGIQSSVRYTDQIHAPVFMLSITPFFCFVTHLNVVTMTMYEARIPCARSDLTPVSSFIRLRRMFPLL